MKNNVINNNDLNKESELTNSCAPPPILPIQ